MHSCTRKVGAQPSHLANITCRSTSHNKQSAFLPGILPSCSTSSFSELDEVIISFYTDALPNSNIAT